MEVRESDMTNRHEDDVIKKKGQRVTWVRRLRQLVRSPNKKEKK